MGYYFHIFLIVWYCMIKKKTVIKSDCPFLPVVFQAYSDSSSEAYLTTIQLLCSSFYYHFLPPIYPLFVPLGKGHNLQDLFTIQIYT